MTALSHAEFVARPRFADLDGLRAMAVFAVIWHHTHPSGMSGLLAKSGHHGVTLFFAISGFLITSLLVRERLQHGHIDLRAFYIRRCLRIFPLYFGTLLLYVLLVVMLERDSVAGVEFWRNLKYFATYTSNLFVPLDGDRVIFYFAWSLATEEQFYLIWPPLLVLLGGIKVGAGAMLGVIVASVVGAEAGIAFFAGVPFAILAGSFMALLLHDQAWHASVAGLLGRTWVPIIAGGGGLVCMVYPTMPYYLLHLSMAILVSSCAIQKRHTLSGLLNSRLMIYLGGISYGLYMLHMLCKNVITKLLVLCGIQGFELLVFPLTAILAIIAATLSFRFFESPFLRIKLTFQR